MANFLKKLITIPLLAAGNLLLSNVPAIADFSFITQDVTYGGEVVGTYQVPDWANISLTDFPSLTEGGSIDSSFNAAAGYDLSRSWSAGDNISQVLKLGDVSDAFALEELDLNTAAALAGGSFSSYTLADFKVIQTQSITSLIAADSDLATSFAGDSPLIQDYLVSSGISATDFSSFDLGTLALMYPAIAGASFDSTITDFSGYDFSAVTGLADIDLKDFTDWESALISEVPFLSDIAMSDYPKEVLNKLGVIARIDFVWHIDSGLLRTVSGGNHDPLGFQVPCPSPFTCPHIELDDVENAGRIIKLPFEGSRWIAGRDFNTKSTFCPVYPWGVQGGFGPLKYLNGCGLEPTGRNPFGDAFKVVVTDTDESSETVSTALFFRVCSVFLTGETCSPYYIGPIPFLTFEEGDYLYIGETVF